MKGSIKDMNYKEMGELVNLLNLKDEIGILKALGKDISSINELLEYVNNSKKDTIHNYLSRFIFIVSDLDSFISSVKENINKDVNQGPQKLRGRSSYISYILTRIDKSFRDSMYNHNRLYLDKIPNNEFKKERYIPKSCFSYKNIHLNLGNVK